MSLHILNHSGAARPNPLSLRERAGVRASSDQACSAPRRSPDPVTHILGNFKSVPRLVYSLPSPGPQWPAHAGSHFSEEGYLMVRQFEQLEDRRLMAGDFIPIVPIYLASPLT